jgi:membrane protein YdbS with pleckstrin-like domain
LAAIGTLLNIVGWIVATYKFDTLKDGPRKDDETGESLAWTGRNVPFAHAVLGMVVMCGACVEVFLFGMMKRPRHEGETFEEFPLDQKIGHVSHRVLGHTLIVLALIACGTGTRITHSNEDNSKFLKAFVCVLAASLLFTLVLVADKLRFKKRQVDIHKEDEEILHESSPLHKEDEEILPESSMLAV